MRIMIYVTALILYVRFSVCFWLGKSLELLKQTTIFLKYLKFIIGRNTLNIAPLPQKGLFTEYISSFRKIKTDALGYPSWCVKDADKACVIDGFYAWRL
jgi:hypothetical protein